MGVSAPGKRVEETKVMNDPMSTKRAGANLNGFIVICSKVRELGVSLYRNETSACLMHIVICDNNLWSSCTQKCAVSNLSGLR